jgi:hypothetical protein
MTIILSQASGNWATGATWAGGVAPGTGDFGKIEVGHTVTVAAEPTARGFILNGGTLVLNYDFKITDGIGNGIWINDTNSGGISSNGTAATPRYIKSAATDPTKPTYPWEFTVANVTGADARSLDFRYIILQGNKYYLGNTNNNLQSNDWTNPDRIFISRIVPHARETRLSENEIRGRNAGLVYHNTLSAASMSISGDFSEESFLPTIIDNIQKSKQRIAFFSYMWHLPKCQIDGKPVYGPKGGKMIDFTIILREDV